VLYSGLAHLTPDSTLADLPSHDYQIGSFVIGHEVAYVAQFQKSFRDFPAFPAGDLRKTRGFA